MDRHLGFLEIPQPRDQRVEVTQFVLLQYEIMIIPQRFMPAENITNIQDQ